MEVRRRTSRCYNIQVITLFVVIWRRPGTSDKSCGPSPYLSRVPGASSTQAILQAASHIPSSADQRMSPRWVYPKRGRAMSPASAALTIINDPVIFTLLHCQRPSRRGMQQDNLECVPMYITSSSPSSVCAPRPSMSGLAHCSSHASYACSESPFHSQVHRTPSLRHSRCHRHHPPDRQSPRCPSRKHRLAPWRRGWTPARRARSSSTRAESRWNYPQAGDCRRLRARAHR